MVYKESIVAMVISGCVMLYGNFYVKRIFCVNLPCHNMICEIPISFLLEGVEHLTSYRCAYMDYGFACFSALVSCAYICTHAHTHARTHACTHTRMHAHTHARTHAHAHITHTTHTHTHTHTHNPYKYNVNSQWC